MMNLDLFEKLEINHSHYHKGNSVVSVATKNTILPSADIARKTGWKKGDRVDLYKMGATFALKKSPVGTIRLGVNGAKDTWKINSVDAYLNIKPFVQENVMEAWIEEGVLFFKGTPVAGVVRK